MWELSQQRNAIDDFICLNVIDQTNSINSSKREATSSKGNALWCLWRWTSGKRYEGNKFSREQNSALPTWVSNDKFNDKAIIEMVKRFSY